MLKINKNQGFTLSLKTQVWKNHNGGQIDPPPLTPSFLGSMKDELGGKVMRELAALRIKTCSNLTDNNDEDKKAKDTKNVL